MIRNIPAYAIPALVLFSIACAFVGDILPKSLPGTSAMLTVLSLASLFAGLILAIATAIALVDR
jgi:hypothetical protein